MIIIMARERGSAVKKHNGRIFIDRTLYIDMELVGSGKMCEGGNLIVMITLSHRDLKKVLDMTVERRDLVSHGAGGGAVNESVCSGLLSMDRKGVVTWGDGNL